MAKALYRALLRQRSLVALATAIAALALASAVLGRSCRLAGDSPEAIVSQFVTAVRAGDRQEMFDLLTPRLQRALEQRAEHATAIVGGSRRYSALELISIGALEAGAITVGSATITGDTAVVPMITERGRHELQLRRERDGWRIELAEYGAAAPLAASPPAQPSEGAPLPATPSTVAPLPATPSAAAHPAANGAATTP